MEAKENIEEKQELALVLPLPFTIAVAINGKKKSKYVVRWALEKFVPEGLLMFKLLHVRPRITSVPTPSKLPLFKIIIHLCFAFDQILDLFNMYAETLEE